MKRSLRYKLFILCSLLIYNKVYAQVANYTFSQSLITNAYVEINSTNALNYSIWQSGAAINTNAYSPAIPITYAGLPGGFKFNCRSYDSVVVSNNGFLVFKPWGTMALTAYNPISTPLNVQAEGVLSAASANLVASTASGANPSISTGNIGPNFIIQFKDVARSATPNDRLNFQIVLSNSGIVRYIYGFCQADPASTSTTALIVGMRSNHITDFQTRSVTGSNPSADWLNSVAGTTVTSSCRFTSVAPATAPFNNLVYTWTSPTCAVPVYQTNPLIENFENPWIGITNARPSIHFNNWPSRGNGAWFRDDENNPATNNWGSAGSGIYSPTGALGTSRSARFHCATTPTGTYGDLDWYVDLSGCPGSTKTLQFYLHNTSGIDYLQVWRSDDGGNQFTQLGGNITSTGNTNWVLQTLNLDTNSSATTIIRFRAFADVSSSGPTASDIGLDELTITSGSGSPTVTILGGGGVCGPGQGPIGSTLFASGALTYQWSPSSGLNTSTGPIVIATPTVTTTYTVIGTDASCNTASSAITINVQPTYELQIMANPQNLCPSGATTMTLNDTIKGSTIPPTGYCSNNLHVSASFCITNVTLGTLNNNSAPLCAMPSYTFYNNTNTPILLAGTSSNISVTIGQNNGAIAVWVDYNRNGVFENSEYTSLTTTSLANIPSLGAINIPSNALPGVTRMRIRSRVAASGISPADACLQFSAGGETEDYLVHIYKVPGSGISYSWSPATYLNTTSGSIVNASNVTASTIYTVTGTDAIGCTVTATKDINVMPLQCGLVTSNPTQLCLGNSATLTANVNGGGQPYSYIWTAPNVSGTGTIVVGNSITGVVSPIANTVYTLTVTDNCGGSCSTTFLLPVIQAPTPSLTNPNGGPIQICGTSSNSVSIKASGSSNYTWSPNPAFTSATGDSVVVSATGPSIYTVTGTTSGCSASTTVLIPYFPNYNLQVKSTPSSLCASGIVTLTATDTISGPQFLPSMTYCFLALHQSGGNVCIDTFVFGNANLSVSPTYICGQSPYQNNLVNPPVGTYVIGQSVGVNAVLQNQGYLGMWIDYNRDGLFDQTEYTSLITNGISNTTSVTIPLISLPGLTAMRLRTNSTFITSNDACVQYNFGETKDYVIELVNVSNTSITNYQWSPAAALSTNNGNTVISNPISSNTNFVVTTTDANGCTKQSGVQVIVGPLTCNNISVAPSTTVCAGSTVTLTANSIGGQAPISYQWSNASGVIGTTKSILVNPLTTTTYTVIITDACGTSASCVRTVTLNILPTPPITLTATPNISNVCVSGTITLTASGGVNYSFGAIANPSNITTLTPNSVSISPIQSNVYFVTGVAANGCTSGATYSIFYSPALTLTPWTMDDSLTSCNSSTVLNVSDTSSGLNYLSSLTYCASQANTTTGFDITSLGINNNTFSAPCNTLASGPGSLSGRYSNHTTFIFDTLYDGVVNTYTLQISDCSNSFISGGFRIYIDLNANGLFTDVGELVASNTTPITGTTQINGTFTLPSFFTPGIVRMRVVANNSNPASLSSCGTYQNGETEDYAVDLRRVPSSPYTFTWQPGNLSGSSVSVSPNNTTVYTVTAVNGQGCVATSSTISIYVGSLTCGNATPLTQSICLNDSATLAVTPQSGEAPFVYSWSTGAVDSFIKVSPSTNTSYTCTITDACNNSCSKVFNVNVIPVPTIAIGSNPMNAVVCASGIVTLTVTTSAANPTYSWSPSTYLTSTNTASTTVVNPIQNMIYTCTVTDNVTGCQASATKSIVYNPQLYISASATPNQVCANSPFTLTATDTTNVNTPLPSNYCTTNLHTFAQPCITNVMIWNYTSSSSLGCSAPAFTPGTTAPVVNVYQGGTVTLSVTTGPNPFTSPARVSAWIDYNRNGIFDTTEYYLVQQTATPNVPDVLVITIPQNAQPGNTLMRIRVRSGSQNNASNSCTTFASGETEDYNINIISTTPMPLTYSWSNGVNNAINPISTGITTTTTYTVTGTNSNGCSSVTTTTVWRQPVEIDSISNIGNVCLGETRTVRAHLSKGNGVYTYNWQPINDILMVGGDSAVLYPFSNVTYTLTVADGCGASTSSTFDVNAFFPPNIVAWPSSPGVCVTGIITLNAVGAVNYSWSPSTFLNTNTGSNPLIINPNQDMVYTVVGTDANGCTGSATAAIIYSSPFNVNIVYDSSNVCGGLPVQLTVKDTFAQPNTSIIPACNSAAVSALTEDIVYSSFTDLTNPNSISYTSSCFTQAPGPGSIAGRYSNYLTNATVPIYYNKDSIDFAIVKSNCGGVNRNYHVKIWIDYNRDGDYFEPNEIVFVTPAIQLSSDTVKGKFKIPNFVVAGKASMRVTLSITNNPSTFGSCATYNDGETEDYPIELVNVFDFNTSSIVWGPMTVPNVGPVVTATPMTPTVYTVTVTDNAGCTGTSTVFLNTSALSNASITRVKTGPLCVGSADTLGVNLVGGSAPFTYSWSTGATTPTISVTPTVNTTYSVTVTDVCGLSVTSSITISTVAPPTISISATPANATLCNVSGNINLLASCAQCASVLWINDGVSTLSNTITPLYSQVYTVQGTDGLGCTSTSTIQVYRDYNHTFTFSPSIASTCAGQPLNLSFTDSTLGTTISSAPTGYCVPLHSGSTPCITEVSFSGINNIIPNNCSGQPYSTYTNQATLVAGTTSPIFVKFQNSGTITANAGLAVWIDFNRNGNYDVSEYFSIATNGAANALLSSNILVPSNAQSGLTKMRIRIRTVGVPIGAGDACNNFTTGATQDYPVNLIGKVAATNMTYDWQPASLLLNNTTSSVTTNNLTSNTIFTVTATSSGGCSYVTTKAVVVYPSLSLLSTDYDNVCANTNGGIIVNAISGGTPNYTFTISPSVGTIVGDSIKNLPNGTYTIQSSDVNGCTSSQIVSITSPSVLTGSLGVNGNICNGGSLVNVYATVSGGTAPYNYSWLDANLVQAPFSTSANGDTLLNVSVPYTLNVIITDSNGCNTEPNTAINLPLTLPSNILGIQVTNVISPLCNTSANGSITVQGINGNPGYQYAINNGNYQSSGVFSNLSAATYTITVLDNNLCTTTTVVNLTAPSPIIISPTITHVSCNGLSNGTITTSVSGGTPSYTITINQAAPVPNYAAGTYTINALDANGCIATISVTLTEPSPLSIAITTIPITCNGAQNGQINITPSGGVPSYNILVNNNAPGLSYGAGVYTIQVTDANNCSKTTTVNLTQPAPLALTVSATNLSCATDSATLTLNLTGGVGAITYTLNNSTYQNKVPVGNYTICATDINGCSTCTNITITAPSPVVVTSTVTNPGCGNLLGAITPSATGGVGPYSFFVNNNAYLTGFVYSPNTYTILAYDANNCSATATTTVGVGYPNLLNNTTSTDETCLGANNGGFVFAASGGLAPYTYLVNGNTPSTNYPPGNYTVSVSDQAGCTVTKVLSIFAATVWTVVPSSNPPLCAGGKGTINAFATGGAAPITYLVNGTFPITDSFASGTYTVTATDNNNCTKTATVTVNPAPPQIQISVTVTHPLCAGNQGVINVSGTGGAGALNFLINGQPIASQYNPGTYIVTATDLNNCAVTTTAVVNSPGAPLNLTINANDPLCDGDNGIVTYSVSGGLGPVVVTVNGLPIDSSYPTGNYFAIATDSVGCVELVPFSVGNAPPPIVLTVIPTSPDCYNQNGSLSITAVDGTGLITILVNGTAPLTSYPPGIYTVLATDANGCTASNTTEILNADSISITSNAIPPQCSGDLGALINSANGGTGVLSISVNGVADTIYYPPGTYTITVTDVLNCTTSTTNTIPTVPNPLSISASSSNILCAFDSALVTMTHTGGIGTIIYTLNGNPLPSYLLPGTYTINGQDANGCDASTVLIIPSAPTAITLNSSVTDPLCFNMNGSIAVNPIGGSGQINVVINGNPILPSYPPGTYTVTGTDANGCTTSETVTINAGPNAVTINYNIIPPLCPTDSAQILFNNTSIYGTVVTTVNGQPEATGYAGGIGYVLATDPQGCIEMDTIAIPSAPNPISINTSVTAPSCLNNAGTLTASATGGTGIITLTIGGNLLGTSYVPGTYTIDAVDANSCTATTSFIMPNASNPLQLTINASDPLCAGDNGLVTYSTSGGSGNIVVLVNNNPIATSYAPGSYIATAVDAQGCTTEVTFSIANAPSPVILNVSTTDPICFGGNGTISVSATGGTGNISILINNSAPISNYPAGNYTILATDANQCTSSLVVTISNPSQITINSIAVPPTCSGTLGSILNSATGSNNFTFLVNGLPDTVNYPSGQYTITATDGFGCSTTATIAVPPPLSSAIVLNVTAAAPICNGDEGVVTPNATGGFGTISFTESGNVLPATLPSGTYTIIGTDANGCTGSQVIIVPNAPSPITLNVNVTDPICLGANGIITYTASGGTGAIDVLINGSTPATNYPSGNYTVLATDANSCTSSTIVIMNDGPQVITIDYILTPPVCFGDSATIVFNNSSVLGSVTTLVNGMPEASTYPSGFTTVQVTDVQGCTATDTFTITSPNSPINLITTVTNPICQGDSGTIVLNASGGSGGYIYTINNATPNLAYPPGTYTVIVQDAAGCTNSTVVTIQSVANPLTISPIATIPSCFTDTAMITINPSGGLPPYIELINNAPVANNYLGGIYTINVTDANGCSIESTVIVMNPPSPIVINSIPTAPLCFGDLGSLAITVSGGVGSIGITVDGLAYSSINYPSGVHTIIATDSLGCQASTLSTVPPALNTLTITVNTTAPQCANGLGTISASTAGGLAPYTYLLNGNSVISPQPSGNYTLVSTDAQGCSSSTIVTVGNVSNPLTISAIATDPFCVNDSGTIAANATGGDGNYSFIVNGMPLASSYMPGIYTVTVTDGNGCTSTQSVTIGSAPQFNVNVSQSVISICNENSVILNAVSNDVSAIISWSGAVQNNVAFVPDFNTIYTVTATNANCSTTNTVQINSSSFTGNLSQASSNNNTSLVGNGCDFLIQVDGDSVNYTDQDCDLIATVFDPMGGNQLDSIAACVDVLPNIDIVSGEPYTERRFTLEPKNNGMATIILYYTNEDLLNYNTFVKSNFPLKDTFTTMPNASSIPNGATTNGRIGKFANLASLIPDTFINVVCVWDSNYQYWSATFDIPSFSVFRLQTAGSNAPLGLMLLDFKGEALDNRNLITFITSEEKNINKYIIERSFDMNKYDSIGEVKAINASGIHNYSFNDFDIRSGNTYYRLKIVELDNSFDFTKYVSVSREKLENSILIFPNPVDHTLHFTYSSDLESDLKITLLDATGKIVKVVNTQIFHGKTHVNIDVSELANGTYFMHCIEGNGNINRSQFKKATKQ